MAAAYTGHQNKFRKTTKAERSEIRANHEARKQAGKEFKKHPTGVRCPLCGKHVDKLQQIRRADLVVVPGCAACAKQTHESAVLPAAPKMPAFLTGHPIETRYTSAADWERANGITRRPFLALPAPRMNEYMRPVRRQLARMVGPRPRYIPTGAIHNLGEVIYLGPGDKPSPYQPDQIALWRQRFLDEMSEAVELRGKVLTGEALDSDWGARGERRIHHPVWEADCAAQRMQHAAFMFGNALKAA